MSRELNPELFPELRRSEAAPKPSESHLSEGVSEEDIRLLAGQVEILKRRLKDHESRIEMANTRITDLVNATKSKFERVLGFTQRLDEFTKSSLRDMITKHSQLVSRVNERKLDDTKIQELVDRHNQLVQSFELRMTQMQKIIGEQELQLMSSRAELQEAQREIARMKRL